MIVVPDLRGEAFEAALAGAAASVVGAWLGHAQVGLSLLGAHFPPQSGAVWRRTLLCALALAERR